MSCEVIALPWAIAFLVAKLAVSGIEHVRNDKIQDAYNRPTTIEEGNDIGIITDCHFIEKEYETPFTDKEILIKTLEEHGVKNINDFGDSITCEVEGYTLKFSKKAEGNYSLKITCPENLDSEEKVEDLNSEYTMNVQESVYLKILDKLKNNNMQLESEEVEDDNTIVLTVNLD